MENFLKTILWQQLGAAIDMLENAMRSCPDEVWSDSSRQPQFWYLAYHTLFWLDFYLDNSPATFLPRAPFTLDEMDADGILPERPYSKDELLSYLVQGREKCRVFIAALTEKTMQEEMPTGSFAGTRLESILSILRHNQHHAAQLNLMLRQQTNSAPRWVRRTATSLTAR
ncbi:MAG TPA: DinB family protein [Pyrinomonadaceae bacterium]|nr:DinB family protein [Pyrinomonadaceae bacterium]